SGGESEILCADFPAPEPTQKRDLNQGEGPVSSAGTGPLFPWFNSLPARAATVCAGTRFPRDQLVEVGEKLRLQPQRQLHRPQQAVRSPEQLELLFGLGGPVSMNPGVPVALGSSLVGSSVHSTPFTAANGRRLTGPARAGLGPTARGVSQDGRLHGIDCRIVHLGARGSQSWCAWRWKVQLSVLVP